MTLLEHVINTHSLNVLNQTSHQEGQESIRFQVKEDFAEHVKAKFTKMSFEQYVHHIQSMAAHANRYNSNPEGVQQRFVFKDESTLEFELTGSSYMLAVFIANLFV
ncbi:hypothetical protein [Priestia koreensis]|uniref:hypothetical protein n=1 Tax=Priestia koreensis TaxID=284581 RepID=UPI001F5805DE|nr:hypothetical protein [Priestia koreensis]UNL87460.1 hypothetical protein IE339_24395 [Priestia koreensis]